MNTAPNLSALIRDRLAKASVTVTDAELAVLLIDAGLDGYDTYKAEHKAPVSRVVLAELERLLATPDQTEGDLSLKWDRAAVSRYCEGLRVELGLSAQGTPTVRDCSNLW